VAAADKYPPGVGKVALVTVVHGEAYEQHANRLYESACEFFMPNRGWEFIQLEGRPGWPDATLYRYHVIREHWQEHKMARLTHVFMSDADMVFEGYVGDEILGDWGITATEHPGYVGKARSELPYETRYPSKARVPDVWGERYYCGGFIGGEVHAFRQMCNRLRWRIDYDRDKLGMVATWHDESYLNAVLAVHEPEITLTPAYCYPDQDDWYRTFWPMDYPRLLVAVDKPAHERGDR